MAHYPTEKSANNLRQKFQITLHNFEFCASRNDLALIELSENISEVIATPICLPNEDLQLVDGLYAAGYGVDENGRALAQVVAQKYYGVDEPSHKIVTRTFGRAIPSDGDGGPLFRTVDNGTHTLVGINSNGETRCPKADVGENFEAEYVDVRAYLDWICKYSGNEEQNRRSKRSYGGRKFKENEYPWTVLLKGQGECSGVLISQRHVLTAAHCVLLYDDDHRAEQCNSDKNYNVVAVKISPRSVFIHFRATETDCDDAEYCPPHDVAKITVHNLEICTLHNDIALIELKENISETVATPICMPSEDLQLESVLYAAGSGMDHDAPITLADSSRSSRGQQVVAQRKHSFNKTTKKIVTVTFGKTILPGDSGGPLFQVDESDRHILVGINSAGNTARPKANTLKRFMLTYVHIWIGFANTQVTRLRDHNRSTSTDDRILSGDEVKNVRSKRSSGGRKFKENEYPWTVMLSPRMKQRNRFISKRIVSVMRSPDELLVYLSGNKTDCNDLGDCPSYKASYNLSKITVHNFEFCNLKNDIALIELKENISGTIATPICMPTENLNLEYSLYASGSGIDENAPITLEDPDRTSRGQQVVAQQKLGVRESSHTIITLTFDKTIFPGDSGGPLFQIDENDRHILVGLVSAMITQRMKADVGQTTIRPQTAFLQVFVPSKMTEVTVRQALLRILHKGFRTSH
ncbi:trypsin [Ancylostoma ceylanicum]|uniref:Trypsin n=1 Tax=Ancylostoma ceylanicum TaxID=53326 RepID=A0A0D6MDB7_9BILA|nr:trypsin [Ancylostoma ceylanicum]